MKLFSHEPRPGIIGWLFTTDHKRIGLMYLWTTVLFFLVAGIFALLIRTELLTPGRTIMGADAYNRVFSIHGIIMVFLFIIPVIPAALGNYFLPLMLGARDVAFPKLNILSYWIYVLGALIAVGGLVFGSIDTGWTFYTPYSIQTPTNVILMTLAVFVLGFSSILTGLNFIVTIHRLRAPGLTWGRLPLFVWALYATSLIQVIATPVIGITLLLLLLERVFGIGFFDPSKGGDPIMFQHFFWFYSHPAVYIMILPGMGIISEIIPVFSRKRIFGYWFIAGSSFAIAFISFLVWGHHMFTSGMSDPMRWLFSFLTFFVAVPTAIKIFNWTATMYRGSIEMKTPMLYAMFFLTTFAIGGLTGLWLGTLATDIYLHDTYFVVAHFHYTMMGGTVLAFFAGLHYWFPKMTGRMYNEKWAKIAAWLIFLGFNITFFTQFFLGTEGMPRRYWDYLPQFQNLHVISTIGSYILSVGITIMFVNLLISWRKGEKAPKNPWNAATLEWTVESPPPYYNFKNIPTVEHGPYDYEHFIKRERKEV